MYGSVTQAVLAGLQPDTLVSKAPPPDTYHIAIFCHIVTFSHIDTGVKKMNKKS